MSTSKSKASKKERPSETEIMSTLEKLYEKSINGIPVVSPPIKDLADQYLCKHDTVEKAAKSFINYQIAKCATSGFLTGFGGIITLPVTIPANIGSVLYVQMRMIACLAHMGGYKMNSDQTQTLVYACLAGVSLDTIVKQTGIKLGTKLSLSLVEKIPGTALTKINQKVGFRLFTKFGSTGVINIGKMVPVVGAVVGGTFDFFETKVIANRAYKLFINGDLSAFGTTDTDENFVFSYDNEPTTPIEDDSETT